MVVLNKRIILISAQPSSRIGQHVGEFGLGGQRRQHAKPSPKDLLSSCFVDLAQVKLRMWRDNAVQNFEFVKPPVVLLDRTNEANAGGSPNRHAKSGGFAQLPFRVNVGFFAVKKPAQQLVWIAYAQRLGKARSMFEVVCGDFNDPFVALSPLIDELHGRDLGCLEERLRDLRKEQAAPNDKRRISIRRYVESRAPVQGIGAQFVQATGSGSKSDDLDPMRGKLDCFPPPEMDVVPETRVVTGSDSPGLIGTGQQRPVLCSPFARRGGMWSMPTTL